MSYPIEENVTFDLSDAIKRAVTDPAAFQPVYEAYFSRVYHYCLRRIGSVQEAEDLTSQIFTQALRHIDSFRGGSFPAWLFRIAHNAVINHRRDAKVSIPLDAVEEIGADDGALERLISLEERRQILRLLSELPDEQRDLLSLRMVARLSAKEIGEMKGMSAGAVRVAIHRIVGQLRSAWTEERIP